MEKFIKDAEGIGHFSDRVFGILTQLSDRFARHAQLETQVEFANDEITALYSMLSMIRTTHPEIELEIMDLQRSLRQLALMLRQKNPSFYAN